MTNTSQSDNICTMKIENLSVPTITLDTKEIYDFYVGIAKDVLWNTESYRFDVGLINALVRGNFEAIRKQFKDGNTAMLMHMDTMEANANAEIRITHNGRVLGVILNSEIYY